MTTSSSPGTVHATASLGYEDDDVGVAASIGLGAYYQTPSNHPSDGGVGVALGADLGGTGDTRWWLGPRLAFASDWGWMASLEAGLRFSL